MLGFFFSDTLQGYQVFLTLGSGSFKGGVASETRDMTQYVSDGHLSKYIGAEVVVLSL